MLNIFQSFVKWFLNILYGQLAIFYNLVSYLVSFGDWYRWVFEIQDYLLLNEKILEVGFGTGKLINALTEKNFLIYGIDSSKQMIKISQASRKLKTLKLVRGNNLSLPYENNCFDKVIATFPSDYVYKSQFINEVLRVLRNDGELLILLGVSFIQKGMMNKILQFFYTISGQTSSKVKIETLIKEVFSQYPSLSIEWRTFRNVELCFLKIIKC